MKITKRNVLYFFLGMFTMLLIESIIDWGNTKKDFLDGFYGRPYKSTTEQTQ